LPDLQNNPRKRFDVPVLSEENAQKTSRDMRFLPFDLTKNNENLLKTKLEMIFEAKRTVVVR
jgi:hypothetical protein